MIRSPRFEGVLLDMDGTLIDSEPLHEVVDREVFAEGNVAVQEADWPTFTGRPSAEVFHDMLGRYGGTMTVEEMVALKQALFLERTQQIDLLTGARRLLRDLHAQGVPTALVTSTERALVTPILAGLGLDFGAVVTANDVARTKPDPEPYLRGAAALGVEPASCIVVEDSITGVRSGLAAGCFVAALPTSFPPDVLLEAGVHAVLPDLDALRRLLFGA